MNKRAGISEHAILNVIAGIIVVMGIAIIWPIVGRIIGGGGEQRTAEVGLDSLHQRVLEVLANPAPFAAVRNHPLFIQENAYMIVAFNADDDVVQSGCYVETATRPAACLPDKSCLCLYPDTAGQDFDDDGGFGAANKPVLCKFLPPEVVFVAPWDGLEELGIKKAMGTSDSVKGWNMGVSMGAPSIKATGIKEHENFLLYGQCSDTVWNKQETYIEKVIKPDGTIQVFIARESPHTQERFEKLPKQVAPPLQPTVS